MNARTAQVGIDQKGLALLKAMGHRKMDGSCSLAFARHRRSHEQAARPAGGIGEQDRIAQSADGFFERGSLAAVSSGFDEGFTAGAVTVSVHANRGQAAPPALNAR